MTTIALLGTGLLGAGMVENLLAKGNSVRIWNRTASKMEPLVARGATACASPAAAAQGAERVHLVLAADDAVDSTIEQLRAGLAANTPIIDHSTNLPQRVAQRMEALRREGLRYLSAPVFMSPQNGREASGLMLLAGPTADAEALQPALATMTGKLWYLGERADLAAVYKLAGNSLFFAMAAAMHDVLAIGKGCDVDTQTMLGLFDVFKPGAALPGLGQRVANAGNGPASFELAMAHKDARLMLEACGQQPALLLPAIASAMERALQRGLGSADYAVFTKT